MFGFKAELTAMMVYDFIRDIFIARWKDFVRNSPIPDTTINP